MSIVKGLKYTKEHEWIRVEGNKAIIGITHPAQEMLGDVVFVELPEVGTEVEAHESVASIESVKAVSDVYSPLSGKIVAVNTELEDAPETVNKDAYGDGWIFEIDFSEESELEDLLSAEEYEELVSEVE